MGSSHLAGLWCRGPGRRAGLSVCSPDPWAPSPGSRARRGGRRVSCSRLILLTEDGAGRGVSRGPDALSHRVKPRGGTGYRPFAAGCRASGGGAAARQAVREAGRGRVPSPWPQRCWAGSSGVWGDQPRARADLGDLLTVRKGVAHQLTGSCVSRRFSAHLTGRGGDTRCLWVKQGRALPAKGSPPAGTQGGRGCRLADAAGTAGPKKRGNPPAPRTGRAYPRQPGASTASTREGEIRDPARCKGQRRSRGRTVSCRLLLRGADSYGQPRAPLCPLKNTPSSAQLSSRY